MSKPATMKEMIDVVRRSQVVDPARLCSYFDELKNGDTKNLTPNGLLERLLEDKLITKFQSDLLAQGKWKGFTLGSYRILDRIAAGGMGQVFIGEHLKLKKRVAIKVLAASLTDNSIARQRFVREARAAASLSHENIIQVFDVNTDVNPPYIILEYVDGTSLQAAVALSGPLSPAIAAVCGHQMALGLQHAFEHNLVHRDIKPANAVIDRKGVVKLLDLGIARFDDGLELTQVAKHEKLILGTIEYLAPEQAIDSTKVDTRADIYSLGATLYFLLTGSPPFAKAVASAKLLLKQTEMPTMVNELRPDVPTELAAVIHRMLATKPHGRYQTPIEAANALAEFAHAPIDFPESLFVRVPSRSYDAGSVTPSLSKASSSKLGRYSQTPVSIASRSGKSDSNSALGLEKTELSIPAVSVMDPSSAFDFRELVLSSAEQTTHSDIGVATPLPAQPRQPDSRRSSQTGLDANATRKRKRTILLASLAGGLAVIGVMSYAIFSLLLPSPKGSEAIKPKSREMVRVSAATPVIPESTGSTLIVAKSGKPGHFPTIASAVQAAGSNVNRIEIWEETIQEVLNVGGSTTLPRNMAIVGKGPVSGRTTITVPSNVVKNDWAHRINTASGLTLDNITFDGQQEATHLLHIQGKEIVVQNVTVRNFTMMGLTMVGVNGGTLSHCRFTPAPSAKTGNLLSFHNNAQRIIVHDCRFDGEVPQGIVDAGLLDAQIVGNRFGNLTHAISLAALPTAGRGMVIRQNTFASCDEAIRLQSTPSAGPKQMLTIEGNVFCDVTKATSTPGLRLSPLKTDAKKIWTESYDANGVKKPGTRFYRTSVAITEKQLASSKLILDCGSHASFRAWVNGAPIADWVKSDQSVSRWDLAKHLKVGSNTLAIAVASNHPTSPTANEINGSDAEAVVDSLVRPFLVVRLRDEATGESLQISSGKNWRSAMTRDPLWTMTDYDDSKWTAPWEVVDATGKPEPLTEVWDTELFEQLPGITNRFTASNNVRIGKNPLAAFPNITLASLSEWPGKEAKDDATYLRFRKGVLSPELESKIGTIVGIPIPIPTMPTEAPVSSSPAAK